MKVFTRKGPVWWGPRGIIGLRHVVIRPSNSGTQLWVVKSSMRTVFARTKWPEFWHMTFSCVFQKVCFVFWFKLHGSFLQWVRMKKFCTGSNTGLMPNTGKIITQFSDACESSGANESTVLPMKWEFWTGTTLFVLEDFSQYHRMLILTGRIGNYQIW